MVNLTYVVVSGDKDVSLLGTHSRILVVMIILVGHLWLPISPSYSFSLVTALPNLSHRVSDTIRLPIIHILLIFGVLVVC